jgi:hypothetical protein
MRAVHDILYDKSPGAAPGPCAFIQHGNPETGYEYEVVCPFCSNTVGDRIGSPDDFTYGWLLGEMKSLMSVHVRVCTADMSRMRIFVTRVPLGTDQTQKVM